MAQVSSERLLKLIRADQPLRVRGVENGLEVVEIPAAAAAMLMMLLAEMAKGNAVTLIPIHAELTTQQVADLLGVSRPWVIKEIEEGRLPYRMIGSHRRVLFKDFVEYKKRLDASREAAMDELARLDQEIGLV